MNSHNARTITAILPQPGFDLSRELLSQFWKWVRRPMLINSRRRELNHLSDRVLKDIGVSRGEIDGITLYAIDGRADGSRRRGTA